MTTTKTTTPSLLSLPPELHQEILCRTPAEVIIRSKTMCKDWKAIVEATTTTEKFLNKHFAHSPERLIRTGTVDTVSVFDPVTRTRSSTLPVPREFQDPVADTLLHCDGLLLCRRRGCHVKGFEPEDPKRPQIAIWNPVLRKVKWIVPSHCVSRYNNFGFGYKKRRGDYMILRFPRIEFQFVDGKNPVEIYELKNESWRTLDHVKKVDWVVDRSCQGVSALGNTYWVAGKKKKKKKKKSYILGFDFAVETFKNVCLCPTPSRGGELYLSCFREARLSLLQQAGGSKKIEVWLSNNLADETVSFTPYFSVDSPGLPALKPDGFTAYPVYCFVEDKSVVAWCEAEREQDQRVCTYCTLYEIGVDGLRNSTETERNEEGAGFQLPDICGHVYVPSFVPMCGYENKEKDV